MESLRASITSVNTWCIHMTTLLQMDYISTWVWAITILVTSLSMTFSANDWYCVSSTTQNRHWSSLTAFDWYPVLVTIQLQPPYQDGTSPFGLLGISNTGTGTWVRTRDDRVKVCCVSNYTIPEQNYLVVIEGIDPSSSAYEAGAHPSTPYHLGCRMRIELMIAESQPAVLPLN